MSEQKHSPLPWRVDETKAGGAMFVMADAAPASECIVCAFHVSTPLCGRVTRDANAALIVRAVNAHEDLLAHLGKMIGLARSLAYSADEEANESKFPEIAGAMAVHTAAQPPR